MFNEFKKFALRGNVIDLAVGVVIGTAFGKIVTSFVNDIIMPPISILTGGVDFSNLIWKLGTDPKTNEAITVNYGAFINTIVNFIIIAFAIFFVIRWMNKLHKKEEAPKEPPAPSSEEILLTEIRDLLKNK